MAQTDSNKKTINGNEYEVYMMPPTPSHELLMELLKMLGPGVGPLIDSAISGGNLDPNKEVDMGMFSRAMATICHSLDIATTRKLINELAKVTLVNNRKLGGQDGIFEAHFVGKMDELYSWLFFAARVQWGKCWGALGLASHLTGAQTQSP